MEKYDFKAIEKKWQDYWEKHGTFRAADFQVEKPKYFPLIEFPYPSGAGLHVGHPRPYTALDIVARKRRMEGYNVLYPIGWDAFGLPTENYAIKTGRPPADVTAENIATFKRQIKSLGISFDWSREIDTTDPKYYKWTQWIFLQLFKHGLAYKVNMPINWCPNCKIGLANEEVVDGTCERCGSPVEKRDKEQWMLAITKYADRLLEDLDTVDYIPQAKTQQTNWIGKSEGAEIDFAVKGSEEKIRVFTTRPDTLFGATYMVLAPEHRLLDVLRGQITNWDEVDAYRKATRMLKDMDRSAEGREKTGVRVEGVFAVNPATNEEIPVFIADYVLGSYGTGAIMAVPAHDERDFEFAQKYDLPVRRVVDTTKYFIFDFDGVIGDTFEASAQAKMKMGGYADLDAARASTIEYSSKIPNHNRKHTLTPEQMQEQHNWTNTYGNAMKEIDFSLFDAFVEEIMKIPNVQFAIVSNGSRIYIDSALEKSSLQPTHVLAFEDHHSKEEKIERVCSDWGVSVKDVYYFTDTNGDVYELQDLLDRKKIIGCAWGYLGKKALEEVLPREQILENFADIHNVYDKLLYTGHGTLINSRTFDGVSSEDAKWKITETVGGNKTVKYKLRDWVFSRQRYWGEPIPLVNCANCGGWVALPEDQLPLELPHVDKYQPTDTGESPLSTLTDWVSTSCPQCGGPARRETDTMPNWAGSSWYFLRYAAVHDDAFFTKPKAWARPSIEPNEHDQAVWQTFLTMRDAFKREKIGFWICGSMFMNALNRALWVHMDDVDVHVHGRDYERAIATLESVGMTVNKRREGSVEITHGEVDVELVEVVMEEDSLEYSYYANGQKVRMAINDLEHVERGQLFGETFRTVSPWHAIFQYTYLQKYFEREKEGDESKKKFLRAYLNEPMNYWMGVDWYNGGMEHTVLHLLYSRFWNKFLFDIGASPVSEPYNKRTSHGLILAKGGEKMSKSKGNVVNPDEIVEKFGADTFRTYEMFMGPFDQHAQWDTDGLIGVYRFLEKAWRLSDKVQDVREEEVRKEAVQKVHHTIRKVGDDIEAMRFNTAVAALMELTNSLQELEQVPLSVYRVLLKLLAPFAPHIAEELWALHGDKSGSIATIEWPQANPAYLVADEVTYAIQVNGKLRATVTVAASADDAAVQAVALAEPNVQKWLEGKEPKKVIVVKGKMVSVVV